MANIKKVVISTFQFSVVVKGIEKKLTEYGYQVTTVKDEPEKILEIITACTRFRDEDLFKCKGHRLGEDGSIGIHP